MREAELRAGSFPGLAYICEGLKEQRKGLVTLVLWNNQLTHAGMAYLGMTLVRAPRDNGKHGTADPNGYPAPCVPAPPPLWLHVGP